MKQEIVSRVASVGLVLLLTLGACALAAPAEAGTVAGPGDEIKPVTESCTWIESEDCGSCSFQADCWVWYGWERRLGIRCTLTLTEYCDGLPTGNTQQSSYLNCGC